MEPEFQKQHQVSQIYLKQFGYCDVDKQHWVSVYKVGERKTENIKVVDFTIQTNIFDLPFEEMEIKRHFENLSSKLENRYRTVILNLRNQKRLTLQDKDLLNYFVANMLCRTNTFRNFISVILQDENDREVLFKEITMFPENNNDYEELKVVLNSIKEKSKINIVICYVMNHLFEVFRRFDKVVLKDNSNIGWLTSDNPVYIDRFENHHWLIPIESEIYFPLSKDFCLFMFNSNSKFTENPLRKLKLDKPNSIDFENCDIINKKMFLENQAYLGFEYLIFNTQIAETIFAK